VDHTNFFKFKHHVESKKLKTYIIGAFEGNGPMSGNTQFFWLRRVEDICPRLLESNKYMMLVTSTIILSFN
jgi:hypothetical protein